MRGQSHSPAPAVHFEITDVFACRVCIAGSFNNWKPDETEMIPLGGGKWTKDLPLSPGTYEYRLVIDGKWVTDPNARRTVPNSFGQPNSLLIVSPQQSPQRTVQWMTA